MSASDLESELRLAACEYAKKRRGVTDPQHAVDWERLRAAAVAYAADTAAADLGRKGGAVKSAAKSAAARANGARGGRPSVSSHCETCGAEVARGEACALHPGAEVATVQTPAMVKLPIVDIPSGQLTAPIVASRSTAKPAKVEPVCTSYKRGPGSKTIPCETPASHAVKGYYANGAFLYFCAACASAFNSLHPMGPVAAPLKK